MANDPGRDLIPVKDVGVDKYNSLSYRSKERDYNPAPASDRSLTSKLDRTELENKYLCYLDENINLKKHCHNQEEKIRRLASKLLRLVRQQGLHEKGIPASKYSDLEVEDIIARVNQLESSNQLLKEKLMVAGVQLSTHHAYVPRSARKSPQRFGPHPTPNISSRTEYSRDRVPEHQISGRSKGNRNAGQSKNSVESLEQEVSKLQDQLIDYEKELETVREQSNARIQSLENELSQAQEEGSRLASALSAATAAAHASVRNLEQTSRRVAENVEIIRLQRHIKAQEERLRELEAERRDAVDDIQKLNELMNALQGDKCELKGLLNDEMIKVSKLQTEMEKTAKELAVKELALQDSEKEINDLKVEKSIIHDANNKIVLSIMDKIMDNVQPCGTTTPQPPETVKEQHCCHNCIQRASETAPEDAYQKSVDSNVGKSAKDPTISEEETERRREKQIEARVAELEEALNKKLKSEMEAYMSRIEEEQKANEWKQKEKEFEKQKELDSAEIGKLKQQLCQKDVQLKSTQGKIDKLQEEMKALKFEFKDVQSNNAELLEKLSLKEVEIKGLEEVQKELTRKIQSNTFTLFEHDDAEEAKLLSILSDNMKDQESNLKEKSKSEDAIKMDEMNKKYSEVCDKYEKTLELLRSKDEMMKSYKKEVNELSCDLCDLKVKYDDLLHELKEREIKNIMCETNEITKPIQVSKARVVDPGKCIFEIHMDCILVSDEGQSVLRKIGESSSSPSADVFITWLFFEQEASYSPLCQGPEAQLNCSYDHVIPIKPGLFKYLDEETMLIEMHAAIEDMSIPVAHGLVSFRECLNYPQKMIYQTIRLNTLPNKYFDQEKESMSKAQDPESGQKADRDFGILQLRYLINCPKECITNYKEKKEQSRKASALHNHKRVLPVKEDNGKRDNKILKKEKRGKFSSSASSSGPDKSDENSVKSEVVKSPPKPAPRSLKKTTVSQSAQESLDSSISDQPVPQITIEVHSFRLSPQSSVANDPNIHQLFIEYSFLGQGGENLETPISLPKPHADEKLWYNFKRVFPMDPDENVMERTILRNMIHMKGKKRHNSSSLLAEGKVRFNVVSEPLSDDDSTAECVDIGHADVSIPSILADGKDMIESDVKVINSNGTNEVIGFLNISFLAYDVLQDLCGHFGRKG